MPTYDYKCEECGHRFEKMQSFSAPLLKTCPECGQDQLRKIFTPAGIVFKGSGWYINDNRRKGSGSEDSGSSKSTSSSVKTDTTTSAKTDTSTSTSTDSKSTSTSSSKAESAA
ncbi:MAG: zinc ribbon domain-containing protein [Chloroflexi bacterium]|uniref:Zinc ribbon domain-containing protein n=1 Tax=Candidatus Chlorohelix allophototropha TaxID=3003348 RepID=A0A8T7LVY6_9CHLR|nr:zinc ribbon domain-containing protein [Chloroflexota bacterium]WJW65545.1 zinc ribbon domain-containing protein [Chloroflexota bacterium L227-S17]